MCRFYQDRVILSIFSKKTTYVSRAARCVCSHTRREQANVRGIKKERTKNQEVILENERAKCTMKYVPIFEYGGARIFTDAPCQINLAEMRSNARIH